MTSKIVVNNIESDTGIATVTFNSNISVNGAVSSAGISTFSNGIVVSAGSTSAPSITPSGDSNTGIFFPSADTVCIGEGGTEVLRVDSSGRVGVGTNRVTRPFEVWAGTAGTSFSVDSSGRVIMPYQPHAEGGVTGLTNAAPSSSTIITFNRADVNVGNHYDTSQYRFNCPVTGNYLVKAHAQTGGQTATTSNTVNFNIRKNGSSISGVYESRYYGGTAPGYVKLEIIDVVYANAGDYLDIHAIISTTSLSLEYGSPDIRWRFSYTFLG